MPCQSTKASSAHSNIHSLESYNQTRNIRYRSTIRFGLPGTSADWRNIYRWQWLLPDMVLLVGWKTKNKPSLHTLATQYKAAATPELCIITIHLWQRRLNRLIMQSGSLFFSADTLYIHFHTNIHILTHTQATRSPNERSTKDGILSGPIVECKGSSEGDEFV